MHDVPEIHSARSHGPSIADQAVGSGPPTIVAVPAMAQNTELAWESPALFERLGSFARFVHFDTRA